LWRLPLKQLSITRERPIFSPSRRPPPPAPSYVAPVEVRLPTKPREPERPTIALAGTIIGTDGYRGGVFRETSSQDVLRLRVGENYHGWVLLLITPREARLAKNGEQALLELPKQAGAPARARSSQEIALDAIWATGAE
jgi:general secretion pathway protein N